MEILALFGGGSSVVKVCAVCIGAAEKTLLGAVTLGVAPDADADGCTVDGVDGCAPADVADGWLKAVVDAVRVRLGFWPGNVRTGSGAPAWLHATVMSVPEV